MDDNKYKPSEGTEHYSPEEMMARLKRNERNKRQEGNQEKGELVTREDGTQVVKVRRRKRRSKQPEKSKKKSNPRIKWAILFSLAAILILLVIATIFIITKYNGASFKKATEANISELSGAINTELTQLRVTPVSAKAAKIEIEWDQTSFIKSAVFHQLDADILATSFVSADWLGEEVVAANGKVHIQTPSTQVEKDSAPLSSIYKFSSYRCNQLDIFFGKGKKASSLLGMQASYWMLPDGKSRISFNNGRMNLNGWPELEISSGIITLGSSDSEIEALLEAGEAHNGKINITGRMKHDTSRPVVLDVTAKNYPIQELLGKGLGRIIRGEISSDMGSLQYDYQQNPSKALSFIMPFTSRDITIAELPMFGSLKNILSNTQYVRPNFNNCSGTLRRTNDGVTLDNINFVSTSVLTLNGNLSVDSEGRLSGKILVGLPRRLFTADEAPPGFTGPRDGLYQAEVKLGGTIHNPDDNLIDLIRYSEKNDAKSEQIRSTEQQSAPSPEKKQPLRKEDLEKEFEDLVR